MRTVSFKSVYDAILQRLGLDPLGDAITYDTARAITEHITERAQTAWQMWDWPQLAVTEERAYRAPYYVTVQYRKVNAEGVPDEFYWGSTKLYYRVKPLAAGDPPIGTAPSNTTYFEVLQSLTTYVERDQLGKRPIGQVVGVYKSNPSLNGAAPHDIGLKFRPSDKGIYLSYAPLATIFICYIVPPPTFTFVPWIVGKYYVPGSRVYWPGFGSPYPTDYPGFGEVYRCLVLTNEQPPSNSVFWVREPMPDIFASYVKLGAAADCLKESAAAEDQVRLARAAGWSSEADEAIHAEIDQLLAQGQKHYYIKPYWSDGWCLSEPWLGSTVTPLAIPQGRPDEPGEPDLPVSLPSPGTLIYRSDITSLTGADTSLDTLPSKDYALGSLIKITIGTEEQSWRIDAGPKDATDPGQITPADYNSVSNDKHFTKML